MKKHKLVLLPKAAKVLKTLGENIRMARVRRRITAEMMCERAGVGHSTLTAIEQGKASVSMGAYLSVLFCLDLHGDLEKVALDDALGRELQDLGLPKRVRA